MPERGRGSALCFELIDGGRLLASDVLARTERAVGAVLGLIGVPGEVRAKLVDDAEMSSAHLEYMDDPSTTDVLTFDLSGGSVLDVDLLVCVDEAGRHAASHGHPIEHELTLYILHGVLHCTGYDDETAEQAERMHAEEDRLLAAAGIGPVFGAGGLGGGQR